MATDSDALRQLSSVSDLNALHTVQHYLYIPNESVGKNVARHLRKTGFDVEERLGADGVNWLVLAKQRMIPSEEAIAQLRRFFESIAAQHGGEYDGWEAEVQSDNS